MDSQGVFCPNLDCPARGQSDQGTIRVHSQKDHRYRCTICRRTFAGTKGTPFYRLHAHREVFVSVLTLLAFGCPPAAIVAAFGLDERTVRAWQAAAGNHSERVHQHLVLQPHDLGQVQADELRVKKQGGIVWLAMALAIPTRLWLGGVVSAQRDGKLEARDRWPRVPLCSNGSVALVCRWVEAVCPGDLSRLSHAYAIGRAWSPHAAVLARAQPGASGKTAGQATSHGSVAARGGRHR